MLVSVPRRRGRKLGAALLPLLLLTAAACATGPSQRPPVAYEGSQQQVAPAPQPPRPAPLPPLGPPNRDTLTWHDCTGPTSARLGAATAPVSCSTMASTMDPPEAPGAGIVRISLLSAGSGAVPLLVLNDAGGEPGTLAAARLAQRMPPELLRTFRIIGMDRRGTGTSDPADCLPPPQRRTMAGFDPQATDPGQLAQLHAAVRETSQQCLLTLDERAQAYDTSRAALDVAELRERLGVPRMHALARGEASRVLTTFAQRHPDQVGRMVLDGSPDPRAGAQQAAEARAGSAEGAFDAFAAACGRSGPCPLGPDPRGAVAQLVERARAAPVPAPAGPVPAGLVVRAVLRGLGDPARWPELTGALARARSGDGSGLAELARPLVEPGPAGPPRMTGGMITRCNDTTLRIPPQQVPALAADWTRRFPLFGGMFAQDLVHCGQWPVPQRTPPVPDEPALPPILVLSTAHDPTVPAAGSATTSRQLSAGVLLRWLGSGHGAAGRSDCASAAVTRFLVRGAVPTPNTVCPA